MPAFLLRRHCPTGCLVMRTHEQTTLSAPSLPPCSHASSICYHRTTPVFPPAHYIQSHLPTLGCCFHGPRFLTYRRVGMLQVRMPPFGVILLLLADFAAQAPSWTSSPATTLPPQLSPGNNVFWSGEEAVFVEKFRHERMWQEATNAFRIVHDITSPSVGHVAIGADLFASTSLILRIGGLLWRKVQQVATTCAGGSSAGASSGKASTNTATSLSSDLRASGAGSSASTSEAPPQTPTPRETKALTHPLQSHFCSECGGSFASSKALRMHSNMQCKEKKRHRSQPDDASVSPSNTIVQHSTSITP